MRTLVSMLVGLLGIISFSAFGDNTFTLSTASFPENGKIPTQYTCDGIDSSPALKWQLAPASTQSFALIVSDPDAPSGTFYHWVLFNIPRATANLPEGAKSLPTGTLVGTNSFGKKQYSGPCPPRGKAHHYVFTLYALGTPTLDVSAGATAEAVIEAMQVYILDKTELTGVFGK